MQRTIAAGVWNVPDFRPFVERAESFATRYHQTLTGFGEVHVPFRVAYLDRRIERNHRAVKQRYYPMLGFGEFRSAQRFCRAFEELRQYFRPRRKQKQFISLAQARRQFLFQALALESLFRAA